jgi:hypothetical protein
MLLFNIYRQSLSEQSIAAILMRPTLFQQVPTGNIARPHKGTVPRFCAFFLAQRREGSKANRPPSGSSIFH